MTVSIEFFGIPRQRAGVPSLEVQASTLGEAFDQVTLALPRLAELCFEHGSLKAGYVANLNGNRFTNDRGVPLQQGDSVLILSADAGG